MALQALTQPPCAPCTKSELDLESVPPLQVGIEDDYLVRTGPKSSPTAGAALEFHLPASGDDYVDLSHCYLYLQCRVLRADGTAIRSSRGADGAEGADASVGPVNQIFHSLFRQVDLVMNDVLVSTSGDTYPYRAYLTNLLSYGSGAKGGWLRRLEGWVTDEAGRYDHRDNAGLKKRRETIVDSRPFDLKGRLHVDMLLQERLLPNNVDIRLSLTRSKPAFHLMDFEGANECHVQIDEAVLEVRKVKVANSEQLRLEKVLATSGGKYPLAHVVTRHFTIAAGASTADVDSLFTGQIPAKIILGMVTNEAFVGDLDKNPFKFDHMHLNSACLIVDGRPLPAQPWQPDFKRGLYAEAYHGLVRAVGMYPSDWSNGLTPEQFEGGSMLLAFDLTPDDSDCMAYLSPRRLGTVKASLRFATPLTKTVTLIAYAQYDNLLVIDRYRSVAFDYNA